MHTYPLCFRRMCEPIPCKAEQICSRPVSVIIPSVDVSAELLVTRDSICPPITSVVHGLLKSQSLLSRQSHFPDVSSIIPVPQRRTQGVCEPGEVPPHGRHDLRIGHGHECLQQLRSRRRRSRASWRRQITQLHVYRVHM